MTEFPIATPVSPDAVRVFGGYKLPTLTRENFYKELGGTFMPGTPAMLVPLGLAAYLPAVLDPDPASGLPDEVALIVYASRQAYQAARETSIQGRMYTHSHAGVFDLTRSRGQWAGPLVEPAQLAGTDRWSWRAFESPVDWQRGATRLVFISGTANGSLPELLVDATRRGTKALADAGADQVFFLAASNYAAIWFHGPDRVALDVAAAGFVPSGTRVDRDLDARPAPMPRLDETFVISEASALSFRFIRDLRFFI